MYSQSVTRMEHTLPQSVAALPTGALSKNWMKVVTTPTSGSNNTGKMVEKEVYN